MDTEKALKSYTKLFGTTLARNQVADAANSLITSQVNAGVSVRMAVIYLLLGGEGNVVA